MADFLAANSFTEKQVGQAMGAFMKAHGANVDPTRDGQSIDPQRPRREIIKYSA